jgi:hypothetical protein
VFSGRQKEIVCADLILWQELKLVIGEKDITHAILGRGKVATTKRRTAYQSEPAESRIEMEEDFLCLLDHDEW